MQTPDRQGITLTFALYRGDRLLQRHAIAGEVVKIGRDPRSHVQLDDNLAARMHAVIEAASPTDLTLIDLGAPSGTLVNGQRVHKCAVHEGDRIQIGSTIVLLESAEPATRAMSAISTEATIDDDMRDFTYTIVKNGPDLNPDEVEVPHLSAIEVKVLWDTNVLHVAHLAPSRSFQVGEEFAGKGACDYFVPSETLGTTRAPIVVSRQTTASLVILPRSKGYVEVPGHGRASLEQLISTGRAAPSPEMSGAHEYELPAGAQARMELAGSALAFEVGVVKAGKRLPGGFLATMEPTTLLYTGFSFLAHVALLGAFAFFMPRLGDDDSENIDRDRILMIQKLLNAAAERESEERQEQPTSETARDQREGGTGTRSTGEEGSMGNPNARETGHRYAVQGPRDNPDPHLSRRAALAETAEFPTIGLIAAMTGGDPNAPTAPWGRDESSGLDDRSARGAMWGDTIADVSGAGGLGLSGLGEGGGGPGAGIGIGTVGGLGSGRGIGPGDGIGAGRGRPERAHPVRAPRMREGNPQIAGHLPAEVIQRIVRENFGRFRFCYENGMRNNPTLQGRVTVKFVIDRSGAVAMAVDSGSDVPDQDLAQCVVRAFGNLTFPQPEGGMVTVVYPIFFHPGD